MTPEHNPESAGPANTPSVKTTVLVIHQDGEVVHHCREVLEKHGFNVEFAYDGTEGVQKVYQNIPDVVIAGVATSELNGYQICRLIKHDQAMRKIPFLLIAEPGLKMDRFWAMKAGADDFLNKDEIAANILKKVQGVLEIYERMDTSEKNLLKSSNEKNPFNIRIRLNRILDTALVETMLMVEFRSLADLVHDTALLNYMMFSLLESILPYDAAAIFYNDQSKGPRHLTFHLPEGQKQPGGQIEKMMSEFFERFRDRDLSSTQLELQESEVIGGLDNAVDGIEYATVYVKEIRLETALIGAIVFYSRQKVDYSRVFPLHLIEGEIRLLMKLRRLYSRAETLAVTDSLTGLLNHRYFMTILQRELKVAGRYEQDFSLAIVAIDQFKQLNETWGHACGDEAIKYVAGFLENHFRSVDICARFGGKHLAILLPQTAIGQAFIALDRFRSQISDNPLVWKDASIPITICVGLVSTNQSITVAAFIHQAEEALQQARAQGGNRVEIFQA